MALADFQTMVDSLVRDQSGTLSAADRDRSLEWARLRYSADCERSLVEDVAWLATGYTNPLPAGWLPGSYLQSAEHPLGQTPPALVELAIYLTPAGSQLMSPEPLATGAVVRVQFAAPHQLNGGASPADTNALAHREAVCKYAAHVLCQQLASHYSAERDSSLSADASTTDSRARSYAQRAKDFRSAYYVGIGKADPQADNRGASAVATPLGDAAASASSWGSRARARDLMRTQDGWDAW